LGIHHLLLLHRSLPHDQLLLHLRAFPDLDLLLTQRDPDLLFLELGLARSHPLDRPSLDLHLLVSPADRLRNMLRLDMFAEDDVARHHITLADLELFLRARHPELIPRDLLTGATLDPP